MANCASCASEIPAGSRFCAICGAAVPVDSFATQTVARSAPASSGARRESHTPGVRQSSSRAQGRFTPGELLGGRYRIIALLGKGGMGEVYRADDLSLDQPVALKFLPDAVARNEQALERFRNEVRIARQVSHPNVCRVYDLGEMQGLYFLSMEYVDGEDLGSLLRRIGRLPTDKALEIARKLCAGLAAAHEKGVLHRDLKPANVMLDARGQVLLTDFGLAGLAGEIEGTEVRNGTPAYMAPEQLAGEEVSIKSDIYALGLVLYEIFTGKLPFESTTLAGLMRAQRESVPVSPSTVVRDLDPMVERVILRCLSPKPGMRPGSALAVAAALPGGDPLAAALAAGETPSPEMVAAAGEGEGMALRLALPLLAFVLVGIAIIYGLSQRSSALEIVQPEFGPDVMAQKARDLVRQLGIPARPADHAYSFDWDNDLIGYYRKKGAPEWEGILAGASPPLLFWYRQSGSTMTPLSFHDDLLTPSLIGWDDPPPTESGMVRLTLDSQAHLQWFERIPDERMAPLKNAPAVEWGSLFSAAGLDQSRFTPAEPLWNSLAASDTRMAWTANAPGAERVEAAALRGTPVFFAVIQPWTRPGRMPSTGNSSGNGLVLPLLAFLLLVICFGAAALALRNLRRQRGDRRGSARLAVFFAAVQMALWLARGHLPASAGTFAMFLIAMCTSIFYGFVIWTVYIALEPYVRRRWPQTLIAWSSVLMGRLRDAVVGRDVLVGCAVGTGTALLGQVLGVWLRRLGDWSPTLGNLEPLLGVRGTLALCISIVPHAIRETLFFFFLIFLLRVLLRSQWLAGAVFALVVASLNLASPVHPLLLASVNFVALFAMAWLVLRWGVLAFATAHLASGLLSNLPATAHTNAWYFGSSLFMAGVVLALTAWAFHTSLAGRKFWKDELFG
jgi:predicted Ser/Thr protein kinase